MTNYNNIVNNSNLKGKSSNIIDTLGNTSYIKFDRGFDKSSIDLTMFINLKSVNPQQFVVDYKSLLNKSNNYQDYLNLYNMTDQLPVQYQPTTQEISKCSPPRTTIAFHRQIIFSGPLVQFIKSNILNKHQNKLQSIYNVAMSLIDNGNMISTLLIVNNLFTIYRKLENLGRVGALFSLNTEFTKLFNDMIVYNNNLPNPIPRYTTVYQQALSNNGYRLTDMSALTANSRNQTLTNTKANTLNLSITNTLYLQVIPLVCIINTIVEKITGQKSDIDYSQLISGYNVQLNTVSEKIDYLYLQLIFIKK